MWIESTLEVDWHGMVVGTAFVALSKFAHAFTDEIRSWNIIVGIWWLAFRREEGFVGYIVGIVTYKTNSME